MPLFNGRQTKVFNKGRFTHARYARNAQAERLARQGHDGFQQLVSRPAVGRVMAFDQRDGLGQSAAVALEQGVDINHEPVQWPR